MNIADGFNKIAPAQVERFRPYTHDCPVVMSRALYGSLRELGQVLHKAIGAMVSRYEAYDALMPLAARDKEVMAICARYPFRMGTYRTDFVLDEESRIRVVEMTTRQPLNGYFISGFTRILGLEMARKLNLNNVVDDYPRLLEYMSRYLGDVRHVCVVRGNERMGEFKLYPALFEAAGVPCHVIPLEEVSHKLDLLNDAAVIEELNHKEIRALPDATIAALTAARIHNDFRNVMVAHDKRFFAVLCHPSFQECELTAREREVLMTYLVPTFRHGQDPDRWHDACTHREGYILKHRIKGKSEQVYAGNVTEDATWKRLFDSGEVAEMTLQPLIHQRRFRGRIGREERHDYVAGTLLYIDDEFFGPGVYRASSFPVTNQGDDRKMAQLVADVPPGMTGVHLLLT